MQTKPTVFWGALVGLAYQLFLIPVQPLIEPELVFVQVALGVLLSLIGTHIICSRIEHRMLMWGVNETITATGQDITVSSRSHLTWRQYEWRYLAFTTGMGIPIVAYEIAHHFFGFLS